MGRHWSGGSIQDNGCKHSRRNVPAQPSARGYAERWRTGTGAMRAGGLGPERARPECGYTLLVIGAVADAGSPGIAAAARSRLSHRSETESAVVAGADTGDAVIIVE
jgi:hypothetical protein